MKMPVLLSLLLFLGASAAAVAEQQIPPDFLINLTAVDEKAIKEKAFPLTKAKWLFDPSICWENPESKNDEERTWVHDAVVGSWQRWSRLHFLGWGKCTPNTGAIRINIKDGGAYTKFLGKKVGGEKSGMVLNFTFENWNQSCSASRAERKSCIESIAVHEFGHAIGFAHEQNRPDTPGECAFERQGSSGDRTDITPWDPNSVMNYCNPKENNNGVLSEFDIKAVQYMYGVPE